MMPTALALLLLLPVEWKLDTPTLACQCEVCTCDNCDCQPPALAKLRIDEFSPITLAPDPDATIQQAARAATLLSPRASTAAAPPSKVAPINRAVMRQVFIGYACQNGQCVPQYRWEPAAQQTQRVQTYQRSRFRLLPRRR